MHRVFFMRISSLPAGSLAGLNKFSHLMIFLLAKVCNLLYNLDSFKLF